MDFQDRVTGFKRLPAGKLRPHPLNARKHDKTQRSALRAVLAEIGFAGAIVARPLPDKTYQVLDGHLRHEELPDAKLPVLLVDFDDREAEIFLQTFDPLAGMAKVHAENLEQLLRATETESRELERLLARLAKDSKVTLDDDDEPAATPLPAPEPPRVTVQPGEVYQLGNHRLLCGDSTDRKQVTRVLGRRKPALQIADPPFDQRYESWAILAVEALAVWGRNRAAIAWEGTTVVPWAANVCEFTFTGGSRGAMIPSMPRCMHDTLRIWRTKQGTREFERTALQASQAKLTRGGRPLSHQHDGQVVARNYGGFKYAKSLTSMEIAIAAALPGGVVWDPCAGSGTSLIAAEKHGRVWFGAELEPATCQLILRRWAEFTGLEPELLKPAE